MMTITCAEMPLGFRPVDLGRLGSHKVMLSLDGREDRGEGDGRPVSLNFPLFLKGVRRGRQSLSTTTLFVEGHEGEPGKGGLKSKMR